MNESRSSTIRVVVERPDHHCGDDLVNKPQKSQFYHSAVVPFLLAQAESLASSKIPKKLVQGLDQK